MKAYLREVCAQLGAPLAAPDALITGWSTDTRTLKPGDLFFALRGPRHDGHDYVGEAMARGAAAAVVERATGAPGELIVPSALEALQELAAWARRRFRGRVIGITGSAGKTTTKEVIAHLLAARYRVAKSLGNLNNHIGLPLSILRADDDAEVMVLEMGMNHAGEIRALARIAAQDTAVVTNVGYAHIENFSSVDGIALAKREIIETLPAGGVAVLNADDARVRQFAEVAPGPVIWYGLSPTAAVRATDLIMGEQEVTFRLNGLLPVRSPLTGRHGVLNLLAAFAVGRLLGMEDQLLAEQAATAPTPPMRGQRSECRGVKILDDTYNANPDAMLAMLETLAGVSGERKLAVLGEMLELGAWSEPLHRELGRRAAASGLALLLGVKGMAQAMVEEARLAGMDEASALFFPTPQEAGEHLASVARAGDVVLFKGSRGTQMELALEAFRRTLAGT